MKIPTIESGIPIAERKRGGHVKGQSKKQLFLRALKIGDSFTCSSGAQANNWANRARALGIKLAIRKTDDNTTRLWRIA